MAELYENVTDRPGGPHMRVLHLEPSDDKGAVIKAKLEVIPLATPIAFEALSYVWGRRRQRRAMQLGSSARMFSATENLIVALRHLRYPDRTRTLWVDALCINQKDEREKSLQVGIMGSIYRQAERVLIWLGPARDQSDLVFRYINDLFAWIQRSSSALQQLRDPTAYRKMGVDLESVTRRLADEATLSATQEDDGSEVDRGYCELPEATIPEAVAFSQLLQREWWTRVWIIQELCLARAAVVICGDSSAWWEYITFALVHLSNIDRLTGGVMKCRSLASIRLRLLSTHIYPDMSEILSTFRSFQATCPVDKVYSLLGIVGETRIAPDYRLSPESCYLKTARTIISGSDTLDVLDFVVPPATFKKQRRMPSWVPDWSRGDCPNGIGMARSIKEELAISQVNPEKPIAILESQARFQGEAILVLKGIEIDDIVTLGDPILGTRDTSSDFPKACYHTAAAMSCLEVLVKFAERLRPRQQSSNNDRPHPIAQLISLLKRDAVDLSADLIAEEWLKFLEKMFNFGAYHKLRRLRLDKLLLPLYNFFYGFLIFLDLANYALSDGFVCICRNLGLRPAITRHGRLCLTPHTCRTGDRIALLRGGRHPYIVRRAGGQRWKFVGPCHVTCEEMGELREMWRDENTQEMFFE
ncbi:Heterokaryon incompatibility protein (HET) domain containing protein [Hyaloscypha variabilis]